MVSHLYRIERVMSAKPEVLHRVFGMMYVVCEIFSSCYYSLEHAYDGV